MIILSRAYLLAMSAAEKHKMKKPYLVMVLLALLIFACKKSTNSPAAKSTPTYNATASYTASAQTHHGNDTSQQYVIDSVLGLAS
jgi:hypothetical protein